MPSDADSGRVKLLTGVTLPLQERKGPVMKKQISIIKAAQETDEKKIIFQVGNAKNIIFNSVRFLTSLIDNYEYSNIPCLCVGKHISVLYGLVYDAILELHLI